MLTPLAVSVTVVPLQIVVEVGVTVSDGAAPPTDTVNVLVTLIQPLAEPVTVYTVVEEGLTTLVAPEPEGNQVYVLAPLAVSVTVAPLQIVVLVGDTVSTGTAFTVTVAVCAAPMHPALLLPLTVYTVVDEGLTTLLVPEPEGNQV